GFPMYADFRPRQRRSCDATVFDQLELDESQSNDRSSVFSQTLTACDRQEYTLELVVSNEDANTRSYWWGRTGFMNTQTPVQRVRCTDRFGRDCRGEWSVQVDTPQPRNCRVEGESGNLVRPGGQLGRALVEAQANNRLRVPGGREALVVKRSRENLCDKEVQVVNVSCGLKGLEEISELRWETREGGSNPEDPSCSSAD
ncbi:MAG: hypothetical protein HRT45_18970, partial [Bdellovibrionales bacterium]|nr:hypothetical protein [Bdellovibrionales bacterium]